jgi:hypothetical protein
MPADNIDPESALEGAESAARDFAEGGKRGGTEISPVRSMIEPRWVHVSIAVADEIVCEDDASGLHEVWGPSAVLGD